MENTLINRKIQVFSRKLFHTLIIAVGVFNKSLYNACSGINFRNKDFLEKQENIIPG
jgi:hypothetical protein